MNDLTDQATPPAPNGLAELQTAFAAHIRDPEANPAPEGLEDRRMKIYRELFFNSLRSLLSSNFPVIRKILSDTDWDELVRDFYAHHPSHTPLFPEIPKEFLRFLQDGRDNPRDPPFLLELAHYEWVELALSLDEQELDEVTANADGDLMNSTPVLSPLAWALSYNYPVHRIRPDYQPDSPGDTPTHLLVYRDRSDEIRFMQMNGLTHLLLQILQEDRSRTGLELLNELAIRIGHANPDEVVRQGEALLADLKQKDILLGTID